MSAKPVNPVNGKYTIPGKNNRNIELTLDDPDLKKYIVEALDGADMDSKLPSSNPLGINWFACFSVYKSKDGKKDGYATVKYSFGVSLVDGQRLYVAYGKQSYDVTDEMKKNGKVTLSEGDPGIGTAP
ncbi:MAG TPA: hypothetical protein VK206_24420 [Anaerolineales bacterium]|nr:hypothetical protein [Anaerolineales bacterium]HLO32729.1 hypothetical protein [Anaerolineales bacterium]